MAYDYQTERAYVFTESGQRQFLSIRDRVGRLLKEAGAVNLECAIKGETGSSWEMIACVDRMIELGELRELPTNGWGQHRVFIFGRPAR